MFKLNVVNMPIVAKISPSLSIIHKRICQFGVSFYFYRSFGSHIRNSHKFMWIYRCGSGNGQNESPLCSDFYVNVSSGTLTFECDAGNDYDGACNDIEIICGDDASSCVGEMNAPITRVYP